MSFSSPYPDVDIPEVSLSEFVLGDIDDSDLTRTAIIDGATGHSFTYGQLATAVAATAEALRFDGVVAGDVVALHSPNSPDFVFFFHACVAIGAVVTTVPAVATPSEILHQISLAGAQRIYCADYLHADDSAAAAADLGAKSVRKLSSVIRHATTGETDAHYPSPASSELAVLPFSSGTTGRSKGVELTHRNLVANVAQTEFLMGVDPGDVVIAVLPFFHIYGMTALLNVTLRRRATLVLMARFDLREFLRLIERHRVTFAFVAPPIAIALAKQPLIDEYDLSSMKVIFSGAAPLDAALSRSVSERLGVVVRQGYGMSEMSPISHMVATGVDAPAASVGKPVPNTENRIVSLDGEEIEVPSSGVSAPGELLVRGPNVMRGYLNDPTATAGTLDSDGFLHTGDMVTVDSELNVTIVDRLKELIKYNGFQVAPAELEAILLGHPSVADAAVIGIPDELVGEIPRAYVVPQGGFTIDEAEIIDFVAQRVAPYKRVRSVVETEFIPKSASGKILRRNMRTRATSEG